MMKMKNDDVYLQKMKRSVRNSVLIAAAVLLVLCLAVAPASADNWNTHTAYGEGNVTYDGVDTFRIYSAEGLAWVAKDINSGNNLTGKIYILNNNINLDGHDWTPIGDISINKAAIFYNIFDGAGHKISNLNINRPNSRVGLFGLTTADSVIKNLSVGVKNISIREWGAGGIAGCNSGNISNCSVVISGNISGDCMVGGLVGCNYEPAIIENCYSVGGVVKGYSPEGEENRGVGGLVGTCYGGTVTNCYATSEVYGGDFSDTNGIGGLIGRVSIGRVSPATVQNSIALNQIVNGTGSNTFRYIGSSSDSTGTNHYAWENMLINGVIFPYYANNATSEQVWANSGFYSDIGWDISTDGSGIWSIIDSDDGHNYPLPYLTALGQPDDSLRSTVLYLKPIQYFSGGSGTESYPYQIASPSDLKNLSTLTNAGNANYNAAHYKVTTGINLGSIDSWTPIGTSTKQFKGTFDGIGGSITNLNISASDYYQGLFGCTNGATIANVTLDIKNITGYNNVGGLIGYQGAGEIRNCYVAGNVKGIDFEFTGGLVGYNDGGIITNSSFIGNVSGVNRVGGLVGQSDGGSSITNCYAAGNVEGTGFNVGGLVGYGTGSSIMNCYAAGNVKGTGNNVGGLAGESSGTITNSVALNKYVNSTKSTIGRVVGNLGSTPVSYYAWKDMIAGGTAFPSDNLARNGHNVTSEDVWNNESFYNKSAGGLQWNFDNVWKMSADSNYKLPILQWQASAPSFDASYLRPTVLDKADIFNVTTGNNLTDTTVTDLTYLGTYELSAGNFKDNNGNDCNPEPEKYKWLAENSNLTVVKEANGNATVTAVTAGKTNVSLLRNSDNKIFANVTFDVQKITPEINDIIITPTLPMETQYDGAVHTVIVSANTTVEGLGQITVKYNGAETEPAAKNNYTVKASIAAGTNYTAAEITLGWLNITAKEVVKPSAPSANLTYNGAEQETNIVKDETNYTIGGVNKSAAAGTYTATVTLKDTTNSTWNDGTTDDISIDWTIDKAEFNSTVARINVTPSSYTYDGTLQTPSFSVETPSGLPLSTGDYTIANVNKTGVSAGNYTVTATGNGNYTSDSITKDWTINKAVPTSIDVRVSPSLPQLHAYNGAVHNVTVSANTTVKGLGEITVKYYNNSAVITGEPKNAGTYTVNASIAAGTNYTEAEVYLGDIVINKADPTTADLNFTIPSPLTFNGEAHTVSVTANSTVTGLGEITVKYNGAETAPVSAGSYNVNVSISAGVNYNATSDLYIGTLIINQKTPEASDFILTPESAVYTGANLTTEVTAKFGGMGTISNITYNDLDNVSAAGTYAVKVNVTGGENYTAGTQVNAGNFTITAPSNPTSPPSHSGSGQDTGSGNYKEYDRSVTNGGTVTFGSSPIVTYIELPEGVSGSVVLVAESENPAPEGKNTVKVFDINVQNYPSGEPATITFKLTVEDIEKAGFTPADVCLYHCDDKGVWTKLATTYVIKNGIVYYEAVTTDFSPFAIVYEVGSAKADETIVVPTETATAEPKPSVTTVTPVKTTATAAPQATASPMGVVGLLVGLGAAGLVIRRK